MAGRFNKILEFIGLVDDEQEDEFDQGRRPMGGQTYGAPQGRRAPQPPSRARDYDDRAGGRYASPARPDYDARQRRDAYSSAPPPRYGSDYRSGSGTPRGDYGAAFSRDRQPPYRPEPRPRDPLEDEFERAQQRPPRAEREPRGGAEGRGGNVVPLRPQPPAGHQTVIYYLRSLEECREVINDLLDGKSVLLNLEDMDERSVQRSIDTLCGAAFALGATLRKASEKTYLIAPNNVMVASTNDDGRRY
ncbi:cell division protein SepF [Bacillota bacterium Meth-B3]|nr:cell division protein SepF [Christensenellaceae bacterium]MEA5069654.1 cell division protein SepF [Christensenellaceae bacterium]